MTMDDKLKSTLDKVIRLTQQNAEFGSELRKALQIKSSASSVNIGAGITSDVQAIREALEIRANKSIAYDFIQHQRLRDQLIIDNLRMENAALNLQQDEKERFYTFCVNAFYQVENIINYYFHETYPKINDLLYIVEYYTASEVDNNGKSYQFKRNKNRPEQSVADIAIVSKSSALCNILFPGERNYKLLLSNLRNVRNEGAHRCMVIQSEASGNTHLHNFFRKENFNSIRIALIKLCNAIKEHIGKPIKIENVSAIVVSKLPGACFVEFDDRRSKIPDALLKIAKTYEEGDDIKLLLMDVEITDIVS